MLRTRPQAPLSSTSRRVTVILTVLVMILLPVDAARSADPVVLQLAWKHQFQFAGYYAALAKGYYAESGLDVTIVEGGEGRFARDAVVGGSAQYGIAGAELILHRADGDPLVVLAPIFQHSPSILLTRADSGIRHPQHLIGKRVMLLPGKLDADILAVFLNEAISLDAIDRIDQTYRLEDLIGNRTDAVSAYVTNEPWLLEQAGIQAGIISPATYGVDFYSDCLFTSEREVADHPQRVAAFLDASKRGWAYAMANQEEVIDHIIDQYRIEKTRDHLRYEARSMEDLILPKLVDIGHMNPGRWRHIADTFHQLGQLPAEYSLQGFLYDPAPERDYTWVRWSLAISFLLLAVVGGIAMFQIRFNKKLAREIRQRACTEKKLQTRTDEYQALFERASKNENRFRAVFEHMTTGVAIYEAVDDGGDFIFKDVNAAGAQSGRLAREDHIGRPISEVYPGAWEMGFFDLLQRVWKSGRAESFPLARYEDGRISVWVESYVCKLPTGEMVGVYNDVTERVKTEAALSESRRMRDTLIANLPGIVFRCRLDPDWTMEFLSEGCLGITGYPPDAFIESKMLRFSDVIHSRDRHRVWREIRHALDKSGAYEIEYRIIRKDGEVRDIGERGIRVVSDTEKPGILEGFIADITERKRAEQALRESEGKYRSIFENAVEGFFQSTPEGRFVQVNPTFARMLGYDSPEELVGAITDIESQYYIDPEDRRRFMQHLRQFGSIEDFEFRARRKDGSPIWVSNSTRAHVDADGHVVRHEGIVMDITQRKQAEKEKEALQVQLRQAQKLESIGHLAGGIAHDFNNILSAIIGYTELTLEDVDPGTLLENNLREIYTAGNRAKDLVKQILAFARQSDEALKPIRVDKIIREVLTFLRSSIPATIDIRKNIESASSIMGNATQVHQVLMNLCTNAAHAMEEQGGVLQVSLKDASVDDGARRIEPGLPAGDYVEIKVSDTGFGIAPEIIDSVFDPYFTTKGPGEGTGMGLAVVHGIIQSYGGRITVDSHPDRGTLFTVYLPATHARRQQAAFEPEALPTGRERILFVDDEEPIARMGSLILSRLGYSVETRTSSVEALALFRSKPNDFDLVVTDMTMPNMTGDRLAVEMMRIRPGIPIVICTGYSKKISEQSADDIGIRAFVYKPVVKADLAETVRRVLDA
ncbi:hypothetical protein DSCA_29480 [Desulfosarcina alkanivorans]|uniref:histidine kinase n=1 Tax=Desulfosarcina alkanivorans TaxID=571177 RepID=A0A5K7YJH5_9BACT|nr:ABC transporter substrate-binding protein [Desulfosarcina alkanivorans]BBO69018.1 hypothetical protein DSCA_29480 [Desulfosarcina alkanivorans]